MYGFGDHQPGGKMHDGGCTTFTQRPANGVDVPNVSEDEGCTERRLTMTGREIVKDDDVITGQAQGFDAMAANVAGATRHQHNGAIRNGQWSDT